MGAPCRGEVKKRRFATSISLYRIIGNYWNQTVCLKIEIHEIHEIHKIYEIHMPKYRNSPTMYEIHSLKIDIHKGHEIHSKATLANIEIHEIHKLYEIHIGKVVNKPTGNCYSIEY